MFEDWLTQFCWTESDVRRVTAAACAGLGRDDIDEIAQEVCLIVTKRFRSPNPPRIETQDQLKNYIFTIARNLKKSVLEEKQKQDQLVADVASGRPPRPTDEETRLELIRKLSDEQREAILNLLPADKRRLRDVVRLRLQGLPYAEIGKLLGMSEATVQRRLGGSLDYVKPRISDVMDHPSAAAVPGAGQ